MKKKYNDLKYWKKYEMTSLNIFQVADPDSGGRHETCLEICSTPPDVGAEISGMFYHFITKVKMSSFD